MGKYSFEEIRKSQNPQTSISLKDAPGSSTALEESFTETPLFLATALEHMKDGA